MVWGSCPVLVPFLGCLSSSSELDWGSVELLRTFEGGVSGSESTLHLGPCLGWAYWCLPCCHIVAGVGCPFLSSRASWRRLGTPPPLLLGLQASLYWPIQTRDNRSGKLLYPVRAVRCYLVRFAAHRQRCERFLFAAGCSTKELSQTTVSFWLRMPLSRVCQLSVP